MNDLTTSVIKAIENLTKDRANGGFKEVLSHVVKGLAVCGFFQCENWKSIVESTFDPCICAANTSNTEQALLANDDLDVSQVFNDLADFLQADSDWNQLFPNFFTENLESGLTYNEIEMEFCRSEGNVAASSPNATNEIHTSRKSSTASNEIHPVATMHGSDLQIAAAVNGTTPPQHIPICTGEMYLSSPVDNGSLRNTSVISRQYEKPSTHSENNVETTALIETSASNVEFWNELPSEIVNQQLLMDVDVDVEPQTTNLMPPIRRISSAEDLLAELLSLSSDDDDTLTSFSDETNIIHGQHNSDVSTETTSLSNKHEQHYPCGSQNLDLQLVTKQVEHSDEKVLSLPLCNQALSQPAALKNMQQLMQCPKIHSNEKSREKSYVCQNAFQSRSILAIHKRTHTGQKSHCCDVCQKAFGHYSSLVRHKLIHTGEKPFVCDVCQRAFARSSHLTVHNRTHTGEKPFVCDVCQRAFAQSSHLADHKMIHNGQKPHECDVCQKTFTQAATLSSHKRTHTGEKPFVCDVCQRAFVRSSHLTVHNRTHTGEKPFVCDVCPRAFARSSHLADHKIIHNGQKPHACNVCQKAFAHSSSLSKHKLIHNGQKPHVCDVCQKAFAHSSSLVRHKLIHTGEKPFVCDVCQGAFTQASTLSNHKMIHTGQKPHLCDVCQKGFNRASSLLLHKRTHNGEKPFVCDVCQREFAHASNLVRHKLIHNGQKPHVCDVCQKPFTQASTLSKHKRIQHGEHFSCAHCGQSFSQKADIEIHLVQCFKEHNRRRKG